MMGLGLVGIFATVMARTFNANTDYYLKSDEIVRIENERVRSFTSSPLSSLEKEELVLT